MSVPRLRPASPRRAERTSAAKRVRRTDPKYDCGCRLIEDVAFSSSSLVRSFRLSPWPQLRSW
jgi:hypothetical protein